MNAWSEVYGQIISDTFDGTVLPIAYIPNWTKVENQDKTKRFEDIGISDYIPIPMYDPLMLLDAKNISNMALIERYTYITPYMGSYRLNYKEYDGSHLGIDIRAPLGTPVLNIANWVVVRTVESDPTGNKFVVIRHDNVPMNWKNVTLYSGYLHLSQILVTEWTKIRKWEILWRTWMSGIATTPHLHFQIDTTDAPFHPYWPFSTNDSRESGLGFYESVNVWLGKENAERYSIHPLNFVHMYLGWINTSPTPTQNINTSTVQWTVVANKAPIVKVASYKSWDGCQKSRFEDVNTNSPLGKMLYNLVDNKCIFQEEGKFNPKKNVTQRDALITLMQYYNIEWASWTSHFLDIPIWDELQWYAIVAYRRGILDGTYAFPEKIITKEEFAYLLSKVANTEKNPSQMKVYNDVDAMNPNFSSIQDYAFMVWAKWWKFYPKSILTRWTMVQMLSNIYRSKRK